MSSDVTVRRASAQEAVESVEPLADVLIDCVEGGASVSFMLPLARQTAVDFWRGVADGVARDERVLLIAKNSAGTIIGTVQMIVSLPENQPHRADIAKLLVHRSARRRGVAQRLMEAIEQMAQTERKSVLVLDTATGGAAERLYEGAGWQRVGVVPNYALMPDGAFCATTFFYKQV